MLKKRALFLRLTERITDVSAVRDEMNCVGRTHLMKRRRRMMVLPGCDRVGADAGVGAGKINGQHFAAAR